MQLRAERLAREEDKESRGLAWNATYPSASLLSQHVREIATAHAEIKQRLQFLHTLTDITSVEDTERDSDSDSSQLDSGRIGPEMPSLFKRFNVFEILDHAGVFDLEGWKVDFTCIDERNVESNEASNWPVQSKVDPMAKVDKLYEYLNAGFRSAKVASGSEDMRITISQIHDWRRRVEPPDFFIPSPSCGLCEWRPVLDAICFEVFMIVNNGPKNSALEKFVEMEVSPNCPGEHLTAVMPSLYSVSIMFLTLSTNNKSIRYLHEVAAQQLIGCLAPKLEDCFDFGGIGVNRKVLGAVISVMSIEIIEMELNNMGTAQVSVDTRRSGIRWLYKLDTVCHVLDLLEIAERNKKYLELGFAEDGFNALAKVKRRPAKESFFTTSGKLVLPNMLGLKEEIETGQFLGEGKFGCVYKLGQNLIVKVPKDHWSVRSLKREMEILSLMKDHPCIPKCFLDEKSWCTVVFQSRCESIELNCLLLEGVIGKSVSNILPCNVEALEKIYQNIRQALEHAHRMGVIHLDVCPDNMIYGDNEKGEFIAQLIDWGSAAPTGCKLPEFCGSLAFAHDTLVVNRDVRKEVVPIAAFDWASLAYSIAAVLYGNGGHAPWWRFYNRYSSETYVDRRNQDALLLIEQSSLLEVTKAELREAIAQEY